MNSASLGPDGAAGAPRISLGKGRALVTVPQPAATSSVFAGLGRSHGYVAAGVAVVMGFGFVAGTQVFASKSRPLAVAQAAPPPDTTMDVLYRVQGEVRSLKASLDGLRSSAEENRQSDTIRGLKKGVDVLKQDLEGVKAASLSAVGQLGAKLDRLDRDPGPKLAEISGRLDKLDRDPDARMAQVASQLTARLERVERQVASADATGSIPPQGAAPAPAKTPVPRAATPATAAPVASAAPVTVVPPVRPEPAAKPEAKPEAKSEPAARAESLARADLPARIDAAPKPDPQPRQQEAAAKPATVEGWMLRDVYGGVALLEGRTGGLREVAPGEYVPGVGEIRAIERRGRGWVVVTSRGIIQADNRW